MSFIACCCVLMMWFHLHPFSIGAASTLGSNGQNLPIQRLYNFSVCNNVGFCLLLLLFIIIIMLLLFFLIFVVII